jgi:PAS domain-containing protein
MELEHEAHKHQDSSQPFLTGLYNQMRRILDSSGQPVFIYLDDNHRVCNQRFAEFLGYKSPHDWSNTQGFLDVFVDDEASRNAYTSAYLNAINNMNASTIQVTFRRKDHSKVKASMILLPMMYEGQILAVHFIISAQ